MKLINQSHEILSYPNDTLKTIESIGRTCYKSQAKMTVDSHKDFVNRLINNNHDAMLEFSDLTVKFITNRGVSHELVRHRMSSFAQESTRYVKYQGVMEFIKPIWWNKSNLVSKIIFWLSLTLCQIAYLSLLIASWSPQKAREVLPNALKTEIVLKANMREWRHIFKLRCHKSAHPQMRALMLPLLEELKEKIPVIFDDIGGNE